MKKTFLILFLVGLLSACGSTKIERQVQKNFKGDWVMTDIQLPSALVDVSLFDDADHRCFQNSEWHFVSNNNKGKYQIMGDNCQPGSRDFYWNVIEEKENGEFYFTLKPESKSKDARANKSGYRVKVILLDGEQMVWEQNSTYDGKPFPIKMYFSKL